MSLQTVEQVIGCDNFTILAPCNERRQEGWLGWARTGRGSSGSMRGWTPARWPGTEQGRQDPSDPEARGVSVARSGCGRSLLGVHGGSGELLGLFLRDREDGEKECEGERENGRKERGRRSSFQWSRGRRRDSAGGVPRLGCKLLLDPIKRWRAGCCRGNGCSYWIGSWFVGRMDMDSR